MKRGHEFPILLATLLSGCMTVPQRYKAPLRVYEPRVEDASVSGFQRTEFFPTGSAGATLIAPQLGIYAGGSSVRGEYRTVSDASLIRWFLEDTRCIRRVQEGDSGSIRLEGQSNGEHHYGFAGVLAILVTSLTLTSLLGFPVPQYADGTATIRIYRDGEFVGSVAASSRLNYATTLYTRQRDQQRSPALARAMALRDAADKAAAVLCGP